MSHRQTIRPSRGRIAAIFLAAAGIALVVVAPPHTRHVSKPLRTMNR